MLESIRITDENGDSLFWQKIKEENGITVYFPQPLTKGERHSIQFRLQFQGNARQDTLGQ